MFIFNTDGVLTEATDGVLIFDKLGRDFARVSFNAEISGVLIFDKFGREFTSVSFNAEISGVLIDSKNGVNVFCSISTIYIYKLEILNYLEYINENI